MIKAEWFDLIAAKKKKIEYREQTPFWTSRLYDKQGKKRAYDLIEFINGYNTDARRLFVKYEGFEKKGGLYHIRVGEIMNAKM